MKKKFFKGSYTDSIVNTHNYKSKYNYGFWRDISGNIKLDIKKSFYKYYVILKVNQEVIIIDSETLVIWIISIEQTITIKKIISNRNDIINNPIYNKYNPQVKFFNEVKSYGKNDAQRELPINNDISSENIVEHNNARRELPLNNYINNENLN